MPRPREFDLSTRIRISREQHEQLRRLRAITGMGQSALIRAALDTYASQFPRIAPADKKKRAS